MSRPLYVLALLAASSAASAEVPYPVSGYVTAVTSTNEFDLEGVHVHVAPATEFRVRAGESNATAAIARPDFYVGETLDAQGQYDRSTHSLAATQITLVPNTPATVNGTAIIDLLPAAPAGLAASDRLVRADGYLLHITAKTQLNLADPLKSVADISTNQWIQYSGVQQPDGTVILTYAGIGPNRVDHTEGKLRNKNEYDPGAVTDKGRQSGFIKPFTGTNPKRIPPYDNPAMQQRVQRIGQSLIPEYQRALPDADPTKIHFRFEVIDSTKWRDGVSMPSGIIVVPRQVVERMQNDDQLAAVLADNIAEVIEKDGLRMLHIKHRVGAADLAGEVAGAFVPGLDLATFAAGGTVAKHLHNLQLDQSGRVSLDLLHDAGYNISQAPLAWWLLVPKSPKPIKEIPLPDRAATLYMALGTTWHSSME